MKSLSFGENGRTVHEINEISNYKTIPEKRL